MKHILLSLIMLCFSTVMFSQTKLVYDEDFVFTDGLYLNKEMMQNNKPVDKARIKTQIDPNDLVFLTILLSKAQLRYLMRLAMRLLSKPRQFGDTARVALSMFISMAISIVWVL